MDKPSDKTLFRKYPRTYYPGYTVFYNIVYIVGKDGQLKLAQNLSIREGNYYSIILTMRGRAKYVSKAIRRIKMAAMK